MYIRKATYEDLDRLMEIFENAKAIMRSCGNLQQWNNGYPAADIIKADIDNGNCYVLCEIDRRSDFSSKDDHKIAEETIIGTMALIPGPDPTYTYIEGAWPDEEPYYVIHRIATSAPGRNAAKTMLDWAFEHITQHNIYVIRIDTHADNRIMHHILPKYGFTRCGVIFLENGDPRDAYHYTKPSSQ